MTIVRILQTDNYTGALYEMYHDEWYQTDSLFPTCGLPLQSQGYQIDFVTDQESREVVVFWPSNHQLIPPRYHTESMAARSLCQMLVITQSNEGTVNAIRPGCHQLFPGLKSKGCSVLCKPCQNDWHPPSKDILIRHLKSELVALIRTGSSTNL